MSTNAIIDGLIGYLCLLVLLTFHEFAHAWTAWKCGDDTAHREGRVSLNPLVHMDLLGTVILPLAVVFLSAASSGLAGFIVGWGKPVPVDPSNLRNPRWHDTLIAMAGPAMNVAIAALLMPFARLLFAGQQPELANVVLLMAHISLLLCFFNLLPVPPLDGSHLVKNLTNMRDETYFRISQYGLIIVIVLLQIPQVRFLIGFSTNMTFVVFAKLAGVPGIV
ncbi:MAG: site-2 protease family protein [Limisphaerales bacterium]